MRAGTENTPLPFIFYLSGAAAAALGPAPQQQHPGGNISTKQYATEYKTP
jgi:hypothetical protein